MKKTSSNVIIKKLDVNEIKKIRKESKTDVYLCGGGFFAGWLLENELIDLLKLKVNPLILGKGIRIFGDSKKDYQLNLIESEKYDSGLLINTYKIEYKF